jgi:glycosyltransferase involved in cell wall biosynthesis
MRVIILSSGIHYPYNEGTVNYTLSLVKGIKKIEPKINFSLFSTVRNQYISNMAKILDPYVRSYFEEVIYLNSLKVLKPLIRNEIDIPIFLGSIDNAHITLRALKWLSKEARKSNLFHSISFSTSSLFLIKKIFDTPLVHTSLSRYSIYYHLGNSANAYIFTSKEAYEVAKHYLNKANTNIKCFRVIPPIDLEIFSPKHKNNIRKLYGISDEKLVLLYMGNITTYRLHPSFLRIIKRLTESFDVVFFVVCPKGPTNMKHIWHLKKEIENLNLRGNIRIIMENLSEIHRANLLNVAHIAVYPLSRNVSYIVRPPLSIMEALSTGAPVVASDVCSIRDVLTRNNGILLKPYSEKTSEDWYRHIRLLLEDASLRKELSLNAIKNATFYSDQRIGREIMSIWEMMMKE